MAKTNKTYADIMKMAAQYGVADNPLFISAAEQYSIQQDIIRKMKDSLDSGEAVVSKEYVKGRENLQANPLIRELPKNIDSANKTLGTMLNIIKELGKEQTSGGKLSALLDA